jgi:hypothetical protein
VRCLKKSMRLKPLRGFTLAGEFDNLVTGRAGGLPRPAAVAKAPVQGLPANKNRRPRERSADSFSF